MSHLTTPTRFGRGLAVPGIDTKSSLEQASSALSYGGLHTPPQSAHESRRPSLQYSSGLDGPFSGTPSSFAYSHSNTPVNNTPRHGDYMMQTWSTPAAVQSAMALAEPGSFDPGHFGDKTLHGQFSQLPPDPMAVSFHEQGQQATDTEALGIALTAVLSPPTATWRPAHRILNGLDAQSGCLGSALFPPQSLDFAGVASHASSYDHLEASFSPFSRNYGNLHFSDDPSYHCGDFFQQNPQVVVPSDLSPVEDYTTCSALEHNHDHSDMLPSSFESTSTSDRDYDMVEATSPMNAYFNTSDEEGYLMVKHDPSATPSRNEVAPWYGDTKSLPIRSKRRPSKRLRGGNKAATWHSHFASDYNCLVEYDPKIHMEVAQSHKPHECRYRTAEGISCGRRFDRSEHLKRHEGSHSKVRDYPCPLLDCHKAIGRPDNAGDHFKTHLRPPKTGKRNRHVEWPVLEAAIESEYTDKRKAKKLLDGLRRWIENGMPDSSSSRKYPRD